MPCRSRCRCGPTTTSWAGGWWFPPFPTEATSRRTPTSRSRRTACPMCGSTARRARRRGRAGPTRAPTEGTTGRDRAAGELPLGLVDWQEAYLDLTEHLRVRGMIPLAVPRPDALRSFVEDANVTVSADDHVFKPRAWRDREDLQETVHTVLRKCADRCWANERRQWEAERMNYREVDEDDPYLLLNVDPAVVGTPDTPRQSHYVVSVPQADIVLRKKIEELIGQQALLYEQEHGALFRIHFDRHLYQPLLLDDPDTPVTISPPPLNQSEEMVRERPARLLARSRQRPPSRHRALSAAEPGAWSRRGLLAWRHRLLPGFHSVDDHRGRAAGGVRRAPWHAAREGVRGGREGAAA